MSHLARISNKQALDVIRAREIFTNNGNSLIGATKFRGWGDLPSELRIRSEDHLLEHVAYWVYSYDTPIAWVYEDGEAYMPPVHYSTTTRRQQRIVAEALELQWSPIQTVKPTVEDE